MTLEEAQAKLRMLQEAQAGMERNRTTRSAPGRYAALKRNIAAARATIVTLLNAPPNGAD